MPCWSFLPIVQRAAVDLEQHRRVLDGAVGGQVDVEVVAAAGLAERDVPLDRIGTGGLRNVRNGFTSDRHGVAQLGRGRLLVELLDVVDAERLGQRVLGRCLVAPRPGDQVAQPGGAGAGEGERRPGRDARRSGAVAASAAVRASTCGASSPVSQPAKNAGTPARKPGSGRIALAVRAAVTQAWRRDGTTCADLPAGQ